MKYIEFFDAFYVDRNSGAIVGHYGKGKLRVFLLKAGLPASYQASVTYEDTASRWNGNDKNPEQPVWTLLLNHFSVELCTETLKQNLNSSLLKDTAAKFGINVRTNEDIDKEVFAGVLSQLFMEIARGCGQTDFDVADAYRTAERKDNYRSFINKAKNSYQWMGIHGGDQGLLENYYVCNTLAFNTNSVLNRRKLDNKDSFITDATLQKLLDFRKNRTQKDNQNSLLIGNGGIGKTLMLQHLFMESASMYAPGGKVPVIVQLRDLVLKDEDLVPCITSAFKHFEPSFQNTDVEQLLSEGRAQLLLDGLDEIDESDIKQFQIQLRNTLDRYPNNQMILVSRECEAIDGIKRWFSPFYLLKFDWTQAELLIDKLLDDVENADEIKPLVVDFINNGFIDKDSVFATNPMLITFIVTNYEKFDLFKEDLFEFYEQAYNEILEGHDAEKNAYNRIFHSVKDAEDFTKVFREFCAIAYVDKVFKFTKSSFEEYFRKLKSVDELENKSQMKMKTFFHDVCATACMLFEKDSKILYIDSGFQEYLFVAYYRTEGTENSKAIGRALMGRSLKEYENRNAFNMLMNSSQDKMDICIYKPFLDSVFRGKTDEEAFRQYIIAGYDTLHYAVIDEQMVVEYQTASGCSSKTMVESINEPRTVILSMLLQLLGEPETFSVVLPEEVAGCDEFSKRSIIADKDETTSDMTLKVVPQDEFEKTDEFETNRNVERCIRNDEKQIVCFGHEFDIDTYIISQSDGGFSALMTQIRGSNCTAVSSFNKLKEYYNQINRNQYKNRYK